jgi:hypothetical protein
MISVNCLQDLKVRLITAGFEIKGSRGWYLDTIHGRWGMAHGVVYLNSQPIKNINDATIPEKKPIEKKIKKPAVKEKKIIKRAVKKKTAKKVKKGKK